METRPYFKPQGKRMIGKRVIIFVTLDLFLTGIAPPAKTNGITTFNLTRIIPVQFSAFVPCAAGGAGEVLTFSGTLKEFIHGMRTSDDKVSFSIKSVPNDVIGEGQATGAIYQAAGVESFTYSYSIGRSERFKYANHYHYAAPGAGNNSLDMAVNHKVWNVNGNVNFVVERIMIECR